MPAFSFISSFLFLFFPPLCPPSLPSSLSFSPVLGRRCLMIFVIVQSPSHVQLFVIPWTAAHQASLSLTISQSLHKVMSIVILLCPLFLLPSIFPSIRDFSSESAICIRGPKYWSFSFSISHSTEYSELISLKIDWFNLLAVQGTVRSLLQHLSSKASIFGSLPSLRSNSDNHT